MRTIGPLAASLLASVLTAGCQHGPTQCCCRTPTCHCNDHEAMAKVEPPQADYLPAPDPEFAKSAPPDTPNEHVKIQLLGRTGEAHGSRGPQTESVADACLGHAEDYSWIAGELWYSPDDGGWQVHYAGQKEDKYGGVLTLTAVGPRNKYKIGQAVYIEGHAIDGSSNVDRAVYQVKKILKQVGP